MEKRRRARINHSLSVLKSLIIKDDVGFFKEKIWFNILLYIFILFYYLILILLSLLNRPTVRIPLHNHDLRRQIF